MKFGDPPFPLQNAIFGRAKFETHHMTSAGGGGLKVTMQSCLPTIFAHIESEDPHRREQKLLQLLSSFCCYFSQKQVVLGFYNFAFLIDCFYFSTPPLFIYLSPLLLHQSEGG
jgi:hypothetical protein